MDAWYSDRPEVKAWQKRVKQIALEKGWTQTLLGRYRNLTKHLEPKVNAQGERKYGAGMSHGLRAAINTPIQGGAADVVVARAGAMSIAELQVVGKPAILVPYPLAAEDHQTVNAMRLVNAQAAKLVRDAEVKNELVRSVLELMSDELACKQMRVQMAGMGIKDADRRIATAILETLNQHPISKRA